MTVSTFFGLQTSLRGLLAEQRALDTTSHNIANANTPGFSRQEAVRAASIPLSLPGTSPNTGAGAQLGAGVGIDAYRRVRDGFLDLQYRAQAMGLGELSARTRGLQSAEGVLAEPGENGIAAQLNRFWNAWSTLANAPESTAGRQALVGQGAGLARAIGDLDAGLARAAQEAGDEYAGLVGPQGDVSTLARQLASINGAIKTAVGSREQPNDLLDRRDALLDRLAGLGQVATEALLDPAGQPTGSLRISFGDAAQPLVDDEAVAWPQTLAEPRGKLGALLELSRPGGSLDAYRADLRATARSLADAVNVVHATGGGPGFFTYTAGDEAATLQVAVDAPGVRASATGAPGANELALALGALRGGAPDQAYRTLVGRIGTEVREAGRREANAQALVDSVEDRRQSVSGVAMDEEMTNLVRFQRAYQASARAMSTLDDALDTLINRTGRVGL